MFEQAIDLIGKPLNQPKMQDFLTEHGFIRRAVWHSSIRRHALLMASLLVFGLLALVMIITRKVDWYQISGKEVT